MKQAEIVQVVKDAGFEISPRSVKQYIQDVRELFPTLEKVDLYRESRKNLIEAAENLALNSVAQRSTRDDADDTLRDRAYAFDVLFKAGRLERGVSTSNVEQRTTVSFVECTLSDCAGDGQVLAEVDDAR